ncbi:DUF2971 domain-containing protein [Marinobacter nauticus]|uniref:DUF2971 domain-containing protein n=1 Tax=Marinobacter nauticus (strain ATCC 700491 / DSM 11845 / VT8) TaxID=351348 RepID=A1U863_MARN8|nr:DUF2971 domain-containing protein [Marinobacter nauticus]ABM21182.1 hypothetical protein Maqu_3901 [Marinobacter nauticus VT8]
MSTSDSIAYKFRPPFHEATLGGQLDKEDHTASIFRHHALFFNDIANYNDPFESQFICPEKPKNDAHAFSSLFHRIISAVGGSAPDVKLFLANPLARWFMYEVANHEPEHASIIIGLESQYKNYMSRIGTLCLNESFDDILSWSHYGCNHSGIAIGFDVNELYQPQENYSALPKEDDWETQKRRPPEHGILIDGDPIPITYVSAQIPIDIMSFTPNDFARSSLSTKSLHWGYERELRYLAFPRQKWVTYWDILKIIRKPILERVGWQDRIFTFPTLGVVDGKEVDFMDRQDQELCDLAETGYDYLDDYPRQIVYSEITDLLMPEGWVSKNAIPFKNPFALKEVIFGSKMSQSDIERHSRWIRGLGLYDHVKLYHMLASPSCYQMRRTELT